MPTPPARLAGPVPVPPDGPPAGTAGVPGADLTAGPDVATGAAGGALDGGAVDGGAVDGGGLARLVHGPLAAVSAQFMAAGGSLLVQVLASRELGKSGYGAFAIVYGVLVVLVALLNGWVGDSLTVLDRFDAEVRAALTVSLVVLLVAGAAACTVTALVVDESGTTALAFGAMAAASLVAQLCQRIFMLRREFWRLVANNVVLVVATVAPLAVWPGDQRTPAVFALAVAAGSLVSVGAAAVQLPGREMVPGALRPGAMVEVARFAFWRSAQIGIRPLVLVVMRFVVAAVAGRAAVAVLEAARLLQAPALTFVQGVGSFLLPTFAAEAREGARVTSESRRMRTTLVGVVAATAVASLAPLTAPDFFERILTDGGYEVPIGAVLGWAAFALVFAWGLPSANFATAHQRSYEVFRARAVDGVVAVAAVAAVAATGHTHLAAFGVALGSAVGAVMLSRLRRRIDHERRAAA